MTLSADIRRTILLLRKRAMLAAGVYRRSGDDIAMTDDERAIRDLVSTWMRASETGDVETVLSLMADDAIFTVPGREPFGKDVFRAGSEAMKTSV